MCTIGKHLSVFRYFTVHDNSENLHFAMKIIITVRETLKLTNGNPLLFLLGLCALLVNISMYFIDLL